MFLVVRKRTIFILMAIILVIVALPTFLHPSAGGEAVAAAVTDWGLSFQKPGATPIGNASSEYLAQFGSAFCGSDDEKVIYLTFDSGYENGYTAKILDVLTEQEVPATFFLVGNYLETAPELVRRMVAEGHIVGNHTYHHPDMSQISDPAAFTEELTSLESLYKEVTGEEMQKFYRPPQGKFTESNLTQANELGYHTVFWSVAYVDWYNDNQPSHESALETLKARTHPGAVVLLHSTSKTNSEILDELITWWKSEGYTFGTLNDLFEKIGN